MSIEAPSREHIHVSFNSNPPRTATDPGQASLCIFGAYPLERELHRLRADLVSRHTSVEFHAKAPKAADDPGEAGLKVHAPYADRDALITTWSKSHARVLTGMGPAAPSEADFRAGYSAWKRACIACSRSEVDLFAMVRCCAVSICETCLEECIRYNVCSGCAQPLYRGVPRDQGLIRAIPPPTASVDFAAQPLSSSGRTDTLTTKRKRISDDTGEDEDAGPHESGIAMLGESLTALKSAFDQLEETMG